MVVERQLRRAITTQVKNNADGSDIANGASVAIDTVAYDTASLSGATANAGGTVTYYVEKGDDHAPLTALPHSGK